MYNSFEAQETYPFVETMQLNFDSEGNLVSFEQKKLKDWKNVLGPYIQTLDDNIILVESMKADGDSDGDKGKRIYKFNFGKQEFEKISTTDRIRYGGASVKISNRYLDCAHWRNPIEEIKVKYGNCEAGSWLGGLVPNRDTPFKLFKNLDTPTDCDYHGIDGSAGDGSSDCPAGWDGAKPNCFKIAYQGHADNQEAGRLCYEHGADLWQPSSEDMDFWMKYIRYFPEMHTSSGSSTYHLGVHIKKKSNKYYNRNGLRV